MFDGIGFRQTAVSCAHLHSLPSIRYFALPACASCHHHVHTTRSQSVPSASIRPAPIRAPRPPGTPCTVMPPTIGP
jgi:hypothetical protein